MAEMLACLNCAAEGWGLGEEQALDYCKGFGLHSKGFGSHWSVKEGGRDDGQCSL